MRMASFKSLFLLLLTVVVTGCGSSESKSSHTHLWTAGKQQHVWSYERVVTSVVEGGIETEPQSFLKREIQPGETLTFDGGAIVHYDGAGLRVGKQLIKAANVHVERNGRVHLNAFIRGTE